MKNLECLQRAVDYMEEHLDRPMNMTEIAEVSYLSERTLAELFCSMSGMPVMDYIRKRRLSLAAEDILHTEEKSSTFLINTVMNRRRVFQEPSVVFTVFLHSNYEKWAETIRL